MLDFNFDYISDMMFWVFMWLIIFTSLVFLSFIVYIIKPRKRHYLYNYLTKKQLGERKQININGESVYLSEGIYNYSEISETLATMDDIQYGLGKYSKG